MIDPITEYILMDFKIDVSPPKIFSTEPFLKNLNNIEKRLGISLTKSFDSDPWYTRKGYKAIAIGIIIALVIGLSYKVYKKFLSKATKSCKHLDNEKKNECINKFKNDAKKARILAIEKSKGLCTKSKDPQKCLTKINIKLNSLRGN